MSRDGISMHLCGRARISTSWVVEEVEKDQRRIKMRRLNIIRNA